MNNLTLAQRIRRRIALLGGSYTHPDGSIELDFEAAAGVDHYRDSDDVKEAKVQRKAVSDLRGVRVAGSIMVGLGVYLLTRPDASSWQLFCGAAVVALGVYQASKCPPSGGGHPEKLRGRPSHKDIKILAEDDRSSASLG